VLSEASTLEHMVMCEYLFAAFSLKKSESEGLGTAEMERVRRWEGVITTVAIQEMTHLALVNNMLISIGHGPFFKHPNFPQPSRYFAPNVRLALIPFGEQALKHFLYLERPEGMAIEGVPGFEVLGDLGPSEGERRIVPQKEYFSTVGSLYRGIERGFRDLTSRLGEARVFLGARQTQATEELFALPGLLRVENLPSAIRAVDGIVEMGEGARGNWENAHFGMFLGIFKEFSEVKKSNPGFSPTKPVVAAYSRPPGEEEVPVISEAFTSRIADVFNASYSLAIGTLSRFYVHQPEYPDELQLLASTAISLMASVIKPLGAVLTTLPVGARLPGVTAGPSFELQQREYTLPHREQAFVVLQERLVELAGHLDTLSNEAPSTTVSGQLTAIKNDVTELSANLRLER
jgi:hypothetical protein